MKHPQFAIPKMVAVHFSLFFLLHLWWKPREGLSWMICSRLAICSSQGCLLGLWAALGGKPTPWRAIFVIIVAVTSVWFTHQRLNYIPTSLATIILTEQTLLVMGVLLLARFMGLRLSKAERGDEARVGHRQFSIGQALLWMTALAVFMAATRNLWSYFVWYFDVLWPFQASCLAVAFAAMWLSCGKRWIALRCFTLILMIGLGTAWILRLRQLPWWHCATMLGCEAALTAASLAVVRLAGYRLVWHWPFRRPKA